MVITARCLSARVLTDSVTVRFPVAKTEIVDSYMGNGERIDAFGHRLDSLRRRTDLSLVRVSVFGAASPEGSYSFNRSLSRRRAAALLSLARGMIALPDSIVSDSSSVCNWGALSAAVRSDSVVPDRRAVLALLSRSGDGGALSEVSSERLLWRLRALDGMQPYRYMLASLFPSLREATLRLTYKVDSTVRYRAEPLLRQAVVRPDSPPPVNVWRSASPDRVNPARWALRTNMLYDALAVPNIGAELYLGRSFSLQGEWMYAWWSHRAGNFFWRIYGGDIGLRWWFGRLASERPLAGHHVGVYAQTLIWDFELGGRGYMGGVPGGAIWDRANFGAGIEYGYSLPLNRCLNIDFCIGIGYIGGACREYIPQCGYYVWQSTRQLNYIGPTKVEISLVRTF